MIEWHSAETKPPHSTPVYAWMPNWNGRGPMVRTQWTGFWWNEFLNGGADAQFRPQWWCYIPNGPPLDSPSPSG